MTAENFAFGPIGKLLTIADLLKKQGHELSFAGFGTSLQLAKNYPFNEIYEVDTENPKSTPYLEKIVMQTDLLISSMDLQSIVVAKKLKRRSVYIDCLFWFWEFIPEPLFDVDLYIRERSIKDEKDNRNELEYGFKIKNLYSVPPIIPQMRARTRKPYALISYGGGEATHWYQFGLDTSYPIIMTGILSRYVDWNDFKRVIITTSKKIVDDLSVKFNDAKFEFTTCSSHSGFLDEMTQCEIILTTAGLVTTQEAYQSKTPLIYLPPSNDSHYILLDELREQGFAQQSVHLADFMPKLNLRGKPDDKCIAEVMKQLRELEQSLHIQAEVGKIINTHVQNRRNWSAKSVRNNLRFINDLGKNGAQITVDKINELLASHHLN